MVEPGIEFQRLLAQPTPFNSLLWRIVAMNTNGYYVGYYSIFDASRQLRVRAWPSDPGLLAGLDAHWPVQRLRWFTKDFNRVRETNGEIVLTDLRMGFEPKYVFSFVIGRREGEEVRPVASRRGPVTRPSADDLGQVWDRLLGR